MLRTLYTTFALFVLFALAFIWGETVLRATTVRPFFGVGIVYMVIFALAAAALATSLCGLFGTGARGAAVIAVISAVTLLYLSQLVYHCIFNTYYTVYSAGNGGQVLEFWKETLTSMLQYWYCIVMIIVPVAAAVFAVKRGLISGGIPKWGCLAALCAAVAFHFIGVGLLHTTGTEALSPYDLYYRTQSIDYSMDKLGMLATMRIDAQRLIFGFEASQPDDVDQGSIKVMQYDPSNPAVRSFSIRESIAEQAARRAAADAAKVKPVVREPNVFDIDFEALAEGESDKTIADMDRYFASVEPTYTNEMTGIMKGKNLIMLTAESFSYLAVDKELTPTLYKLVHEGIYFENFYTPIWGVSTSDGEYVACTGLIPKGGVWSFKKSGDNYMPFCMGNQFMALGYPTRAYHNHTYTYYGRDVSHPNMGYVYKGYGNGLDVRKTWPESDIEMMEKTVDEYINDPCFHTYYMTVSGHLLYTFGGNYMASKNREYVEDLPYSTAVKAYLACNIELDRAMEYLLKRLEEAGKLDDTLIVMSADHYPYGLTEEETSERIGHEVESNFELYKNAFIMYNPKLGSRTVTRPCSSLDIIPTLSNMFDLPFDSRLLMGVDMFSDTPPLIIFANRSFITDKVMYNTKTKEATPLTDEPLEDGYVSSISKKISNKFAYSAKILENNYYAKLFPDRRLPGQPEVIENPAEINGEKPELQDAAGD